MTTQDRAEIRIASYNIRKAVGTDRRRDPVRVLKVIEDLRSEIVILQEADTRFGTRKAVLPEHLITEQTSLHPLVMSPDQHSMGWHGIAMLVRPDIEVTKIQQLDLPGLEPRGAVIVDLKTRNAAFRVVGVHLGLLRHYRRRQLLHITEFLSLQKALPTILAGDFNEWSDLKGLEHLDIQFDVHKAGPSFHSRFPKLALDRFALSSDVSMLETDVVRSKLARTASDHLPIRARIAINPTASEKTP